MLFFFLGYAFRCDNHNERTNWFILHCISWPGRSIVRESTQPKETRLWHILSGRGLRKEGVGSVQGTQSSALIRLILLKIMLAYCINASAVHACACMHTTEHVRAHTHTRARACARALAIRLALFFIVTHTHTCTHACTHTHMACMFVCLFKLGISTDRPWQKKRALKFAPRALKVASSFIDV